MQLSPEDSLRLNVLLAQPLQAVRIDESKPMLYALTERGEARVALTPTCRPDRYIKWVREMFSSHFLGSPSGYPVYLRRWTRMGQAKADSLEKLLLLGEPEAVVAVAQSPALSDELARRV
ncbi:MAG: sulfur reduction protein DsrS, partial [Gammaproteobacteria bacterium]|nr:sulfur reduction protein DsrS [Gammaproteobacteria bacterium]